MEHTRQVASIFSTVITFAVVISCFWGTTQQRTVDIDVARSVDEGLRLVNQIMSQISMVALREEIRSQMPNLQLSLDELTIRPGHPTTTTLSGSGGSRTRFFLVIELLHRGDREEADRILDICEAYVRSLVEAQRPAA